MALLAAGSLANIYAALDAYLTEQLVTSAGFALRLHGVRRFVPPIDAPWVEAHYGFLGLQAQFLRQTGGTIASARWPGYDESVYGTERRGYLQLNLYQRARFFMQRYTTAAMRDVVVGSFADGTILPVYDIVGERTAELVGNIIADGIDNEHVLDDGLKSSVIQHVLQIRTRYLERYTRG